MQTLMDKEKRAAYDALAGFTGGAVNPFVDAVYERDHVRPCRPYKLAEGNGHCRRPAYIPSVPVWLTAAGCRRLWTSSRALAAATATMCVPRRSAWRMIMGAQLFRVVWLGERSEVLGGQSCC